MIISKTPFRLSFMGGGTDLPAFFEQEEGVVISTAITKYIYLTINERFDPTYRLSYSKTEICAQISEIEHPIFKAVLQRHAQARGGLEVISMADIPSGSGLGSSSSFTVGLLHAIRSYFKEQPTAEELAREACAIEIEELREPIGKQDQYAAAFGGLRCIRFLPDGRVVNEPVACDAPRLRELEASTMLFFTGFSRQASSILGEQKSKTQTNMQALRAMKAGALRFKSLLEGQGSFEEAGRLLDESWQLKKSLAKGISQGQIDDWYARGLRAGAWGGKILGAGGGGFLMFLCAPEKQARVIQELRELRRFPIQFENRGSHIIFAG